MQIAIIQCTDSIITQDVELEIEQCGINYTVYSWKQMDEKLCLYDGYILLGDFLSNDELFMLLQEPLLKIIKEQNKKGKPILGIEGGAQILLESGVVPGIENDKIGITININKQVITHQDSIKIHVTDDYQLNAFTHKLFPKQILTCSNKSVQANFILGPGLLEEIKVNGLNVFEYFDSVSVPNQIAAISNKSGNAMAMLYHPSFFDAEFIFQSMYEYIKKDLFQQVAPLHYYPRSPA